MIRGGTYGHGISANPYYSETLPKRPLDYFRIQNSVLARVTVRLQRNPRGVQPPKLPSLPVQPSMASESSRTNDEGLFPKYFNAFRAALCWEDVTHEECQGVSFGAAPGRRAWRGEG